MTFLVGVVVGAIAATAGLVYGIRTGKLDSVIDALKK